MASIDWGRLPSQPIFDRVVEAFFVNDNADLPVDAYVVNGRGGDAGIDIHIRRDGRLTIVQLKFFPEGFSGGWAKTRRKQILQSYQSALAHDPGEWWLVVPTTLTQAERKYVVALPSRRDPELGRRPSVVIYDRPRLDGLAAKHPGLVTYFLRDDLIEAARVYQQETALMVHSEDLGSRLSALVAQSESLDPDWRVAVVGDGKTTMTTVLAKHPQAAKRSPITLTLETAFGPEQEELRRQLDQATSWGTPERVDLPGDVVVNFTVDGPPAFARSEDNVELSLVMSTECADPRDCTLAFSIADRRVASFPGTTSWLAGGAMGASIRAEFYKSVRLEFFVPFDGSKPVSLNFKVSFCGCMPADVLSGLDLIQQFESNALITLELEGVVVVRLLAAQPGQSLYAQMTGFAESLPQFKAYVEDLDVVQRLTSTYFPLPEDVTQEDRIWLRCMRLMLEGQCIVIPGLTGFSRKMNGTDGPTLRGLIDSGPSPITADLPNLEIEAFGRTFNLGPARYYSPQIEVVNPERVLSDLDKGIAKGKTLTLRVLDDHGVWAFLPPVFMPKDGVVRPVGLGLDGVPDAPDVTRSLERPTQCVSIND